MGPDGQPVYDPVRSAQVVAALRVPVQETVSRIILNSPQHSNEIATYFRAVGTVFCKIHDTGVFDPTAVLSEIDRVTGPLQKNVDPIAITLKNAAFALYAIFYAQKHSAELPADRWPAHVAELLCKSIDGGLQDAGKAGVPTTP